MKDIVDYCLKRYDNIEKLHDIIRYLIVEGDCPRLCLYFDKDNCPAQSNGFYNREKCLEIISQVLSEHFNVNLKLACQSHLRDISL